ncbi:hypothetical protein ACFV1L_01170 [Kitasatospora sp. NPDC059646]|uniref:hypothetical protein n=1 Tax=Kitasatospora sp. NPDC059646 TaxID=3346893 RepID=UPI0036B6521C
MITQVAEGSGSVVPGDGLVRALVTAIATLEDLVSVGQDSNLALSTLEDIAHELGSLEPAEGRRFVAALERLAVAEPERAAWIRGLPEALCLDL